MKEKKKKGCVYNFFYTTQLADVSFAFYQQMNATSTIAQTSTCVVVTVSSSVLVLVASASWSFHLIRCIVYGSADIFGTGGYYVNS